MKDWRENIKGIDSLYDIDPVQNQIFLRHQYLLTAKDMLDDDWEGMGLDCCMVAEHMQAAIELQISEENIQKEPA